MPNPSTANDSQTVSTTVHHELHDCAAVLSVAGAPEPQQQPSNSLPTTISTSAASQQITQTHAHPPPPKSATNDTITVSTTVPHTSYEGSVVLIVASATATQQHNTNTLASKPALGSSQYHTKAVETSTTAMEQSSMQRQLPIQPNYARPQPPHTSNNLVASSPLPISTLTAGSSLHARIPSTEVSNTAFSQPPSNSTNPLAPPISNTTPPQVTQLLTSTELPSPSPATHINPYRPHRRQAYTSKSAKFTLPPPVLISNITQHAPTLEPPPSSKLTPSTNNPSKTAAVALNTAPVRQIANPYAKKGTTTKQTLATSALVLCSSSVSDSSSTARSAEIEIQNLSNLDDISVRRTRSRLVYKPERLTYSTPGDSTPQAAPLLLSGLAHLSEVDQHTSLSTLHDIFSLQAELRSCENESHRLIEILTSNLSISNSSDFTLSSHTNYTDPPVQDIQVEVNTSDTSVLCDSVQIPTYIRHGPDMSDMSCSSLSDNSLDHVQSVQTTMPNPTSTRSTNISATASSSSSINTHFTVQLLPASQNSNTCQISNTMENAVNSMYLDDFSLKHDGDFRFILQNPRGIKEFRDNDPEYFPTMVALQEDHCDLLCFSETNVAWHRNDFLYDISVANKNIWNTPTQTVAASCRSEKHDSSCYQPGGVLNVVANNLRTKIQSTSTDYVGRWSKIRFFAKKGAVVVYTVYQPNPSSLATAGVNSSCMQQYRHLSKKDRSVDPRAQLITDLIEEVQSEKKLKSHIIILGNFNEDINDTRDDGIKKLMISTELVQPFQELKTTIPSTRGNTRANRSRFYVSTVTTIYISG